MLTTLSLLYTTTPLIAGALKEARYLAICGKDKLSHWIVSGKVVVMQTTSYLQKSTEAIFMDFTDIIDRCLPTLWYIEHVFRTTESGFKLI